jgi:hypothetical protein
MEESNCDWREDAGLAQSFAGYLAAAYFGSIPP